MRILNLGLLSLGLVNCGNQVEFYGEYTPGDPTAEEQGTTWKTVQRAEVHIGTRDNSYGLVNQNLVYTSAQANQFDLDLAGLIVGIEDASDLLDLGNVALDKIKINNLDQCGVGGTDKCTAARILIYTTELGTNPGTSGFVHVADDYGLPVLVDGIPVGLTDLNGAEVEQIAIGAGKRRVNTSDFTGPYLMGVDFSNAGYGDYEMDLVIDIQLGI